MLITLLTVLRKTIVFWMQLMIILSMEIKRTWTWKKYFADNECNYSVCLTWLFVVVDFIKYTTFFCISDKARLWKKEFESDEEMHITLTRIITQFWMKGVLHCVLIFRTQNHLVFYFCRRLRHDLFLLSILQLNELLQ